MGLFALAAFTTEQRTREIGIRKVLGASVYRVALLLTREFTVLVVLALVPALIMGWYFSTQWLQEFTYRVSIGIGVYVLAAVLSVSIAWLTVGYQAFKAAKVNPAQSLRYE
jgi:putative ABC transport system permease protein